MDFAKQALTAALHAGRFARSQFSTTIFRVIDTAAKTRLRNSRDQNLNC